MMTIDFNDINENDTQSQGLLFNPRDLLREQQKEKTATQIALMNKNNFYDPPHSMG